VTDGPISRARALLDAGQWDRARELANKQLAANPHDVDSHLVVASVAFGLGYPAECAAAAKAALAVDPLNTEAWRHLAFGLSRAKDDVGARAAAARLRELNPEYWQSHSTVADIEVHASKPRRFVADSAAADAVRLGAKVAHAHYTQGLVHTRFRRIRKARAAFLAGLALEPDNLYAREHLAYLAVARYPGPALDEALAIGAARPDDVVHPYNILSIVSTMLTRIWVAVTVPLVLLYAALAILQPDLADTRRLIWAALVAALVALVWFGAPLFARLPRAGLSIARLVGERTPVLAVWAGALAAMPIALAFASIVPAEALLIAVAASGLALLVAGACFAFQYVQFKRMFTRLEALPRRGGLP